MQEAKITPSLVWDQARIARAAAPDYDTRVAIDHLIIDWCAAGTTEAEMLARLAYIVVSGIDDHQWPRRDMTRPIHRVGDDPLSPAAGGFFSRSGPARPDQQDEVDR